MASIKQSNMDEPLTTADLDAILHNVDNQITCGAACIKCKSKKDTTYVTRQTRSADEGMSLFVTCSKCNITFKIRG